MRKIDHYYMCHYQKLTDRKLYVENVVSKYNIDLHWILDYDKEVLNEEELTKKFPFLFSDKNGKKLSKAEISLVMKHYYAFQDTVSNNYDNVVVFEDDIILCEDFDKKLDMYINQLPDDYDILWIGTCCNLHSPQLNPNLNVYLNRHGSRCTHAYVISRQGCQKLLDFFHNIYQPIDWYFNTAVRTLNMNNYWGEPALSIQDLSFESAIDCGRVE